MPYDDLPDDQEAARLLDDELLAALAFDDDEPVDGLDDPELLPLDALTDFAVSQEWSS